MNKWIKQLGGQSKNVHHRQRLSYFPLFGFLPKHWTNSKIELKSINQQNERRNKQICKQKLNQQTNERMTDEWVNYSSDKQPAAHGPDPSRERVISSPRSKVLESTRKFLWMTDILWKNLNFIKLLTILQLITIQQLIALFPLFQAYHVQHSAFCLCFSIKNILTYLCARWQQYQTTSKES